MKKRGIVFGFLLSLLAGIMLGASGGIFLFPMICPPPRPPSQEGNDRDGRHPPPPAADAIRERIMDRLESELKLADGQKAQVEKEVKAFAEELGRFHDANREELKSKFDAFKVKLAGLLSKEQAVMLDKISGGICNSPPPPENRPPERDDQNPPPPRKK